MHKGFKHVTGHLSGLYRQALENIPPPGGGGCHTALLGVANLGCFARIPYEQMLEDIREAIPPGGRRVTDSEIADAVKKAMADHKAGKHKETRRHTRPTPPPFDGMAYRQRLIAQSEGATDADLQKLSPYRIKNQPGPYDALAALGELYRPQEWLFNGDTYDKTVYTVKEHIDRIRCGVALPPYTIPNPLTGQEHKTSNGTPSRRCDAAVSEHRFAIVEFDNLDHASQVAFWHSIITRGLLPVSLLVDSGGKSIHAWLRVDLPNAAAWNRDVKGTLYDPDHGRMTILGADRACQNPARLSRMPGAIRPDKNKPQRLLYLNPDARPATKQSTKPGLDSPLSLRTRRPWNQYPLFTD